MDATSIEGVNIVPRMAVPMTAQLMPALKPLLWRRLLRRNRRDMVW
jgi:hypothetical protein